MTCEHANHLQLSKEKLLRNVLTLIFESKDDSFSNNWKIVDLSQVLQQGSTKWFVKKEKSFCQIIFSKWQFFAHYLKLFNINVTSLTLYCQGYVPDFTIHYKIHTEKAASCRNTQFVGHSF